MAKKAENNFEENEVQDSQKEGNSFFDYLRFGESYTSLILGIIVVIISTALLLSFVHNRNAGTVVRPNNNDQAKNFAQISQKQILALTGVPTLAPNEIKTTPVIPPTKTPASTKIVKPTTRPTMKPTAQPVAKATEAPKKIAKATIAPTKAPAKTAIAPKPATTTPAKGTYVVKSGDTLWSIAQAQYNSGYNWVDIARANNLSNPGMINAGNKLILPKVVAKNVTVQAPATGHAPIDQKITTPSSNTSDAISGSTYTVTHGDSLWNIAVRAYGDGYKWVDIARVNNLANPSIIHSQNQLKIPRDN